MHGNRAFEELLKRNGQNILIIDPETHQTTFLLDPQGFFGETPQTLDDLLRLQGTRVRLDTIVDISNGQKVTFKWTAKDSGEVKHFILEPYDVESQTRRGDLYIISDKTKEFNLANDQARLVSNTKAHAFRTPASIILLSVESMGRILQNLPEGENRDRLQRHRDRILRSTSKITQNIETELLFEPGRMQTFEPINTSLREVVSSISLFKVPNGGKTLNYNLKIEDESLDVQAYVDQVLIESIVDQLLSNAFTFSPEGAGVTLTLGLTAEGELEITVVNPGDKSNVVTDESFKPYVVNEAGTGQGLGLGLAIVRDAVMAHSGEITFESDKDKGTKVTVRLPARKPSSS